MTAAIIATGSDSALLREVPLFAGIPVAELGDVGVRLVSRAYERNDVVFHRGDAGDALYIIQEGQVRVSLSGTEGSEVTLAICGPGEFFGEMSLIDGLPRSATVVALQASRLLCLYRPDFWGALQANPQLVFRLLTILGQRVRQTNQLIEDIVTLDVPARLAKRLLELAAESGVMTSGGTEVQLRLTQSELASTIGATRESTNKVLRGFILRGWVSVDDGYLTVRQPEELRRRVY